MMQYTDNDNTHKDNNDDNSKTSKKQGMLQSDTFSSPSFLYTVGLAELFCLIFFIYVLYAYNEVWLNVLQLLITTESNNTYILITPLSGHTPVISVTCFTKRKEKKITQFTQIL